MNRRNFLKGFGLAAASGLLVPEWLVEPFKGRSQVQVVGSIQSKHFDTVIMDDLLAAHHLDMLELTRRINLAFRDLYEQQSSRVMDHYFKYGKMAPWVPLNNA